MITRTRSTDLGEVYIELTFDRLLGHGQKSTEQATRTMDHDLIANIQ